jgi:hypothetical protein
MGGESSRKIQCHKGGRYKLYARYRCISDASADLPDSSAIVLQVLSVNATSPEIAQLEIQHSTSICFHQEVVARVGLSLFVIVYHGLLLADVGPVAQ